MQMMIRYEESMH